MAIITPGPMVAAISGSIGGTVFSRNKGGAYTRNRAIPVDPNTNAQQNARSIMATQSAAFSDLTAAQRAAWENWAIQNKVTNALGNQIQLSGHQAYVQINARLAHDAQSVLDDPPIANAPDGLVTVVQDGDIGIGDFDLEFTVSPLGATEKLWLQAAVVNSAGISYVRNLFRFIGTSAAAETTPFDNESLVVARFGTLIVGQTVHMRASVFDTDTGLLSVGLETDVVVTESS